MTFAIDIKIPQDTRTPEQNEKNNNNNNKHNHIVKAHTDEVRHERGVGGGDVHHGLRLLPACMIHGGDLRQADGVQEGGQQRLEDGGAGDGGRDRRQGGGTPDAQCRALESADLVDVLHCADSPKCR